MSRRPWIRALGLIAFAVSLSHAPAEAAWLWDQDQNRIDDRLEQVEAVGITAAHVGGTLEGRRRFAVIETAGAFTYPVYVGYARRPSDADVAALQVLGLPTHRYHAIDYVRTQATFAQIQAIAALDGVTRVESIPIFYAVNDVATRALRGRPSPELFPSVWADLGLTGVGVTVGILDSGVNDEADPSTGYPGHESLSGKFVGGGSFWSGDPLLNTPLESSENPKHTYDPEQTYHGTHVAGTAIGSGGPNGVLAGGSPGFHAGLAPDARLVDCKVLSDAGTGLGSADALDWCIYHRFDGWGLTGADTIYAGIDVINMSVGGSDASDGTDANCVAVNAAHKAGIVVLVASGNDGNTGYMPAPAAADFAVTVGAFVDYNTVGRGDDAVTDFSNEGPRLADGDADRLDEMKPNVCGPGTGIMSALGDPTSAGNLYHHINGTSMACPAAAGVAALVRGANPRMSADDVRQLLMDTAEHRLDGGKQPPAAADPFGIDPNYHPSWGWGAVDAYAAVKEALDRATTQLVRLELEPERGPDAVRVRWTSQREIGLVQWEVDRAPDLGGQPGDYVRIAEVPVGSPSAQIHGVPNRHVYEHVDANPLPADAWAWYRVRWIDGMGRSRVEPAQRVRIQDSPVIARVRYSFTHNYSDGDLAIRFGTGASTAAPVWFRNGPDVTAADSMVIEPGVNFTGTERWYFHFDLTADDLVGGFLPPSAANPWFLAVKEGGYINTKGRVNDFSVTVFDGPSSTTWAAPNPVTETIEKQETVFWIPLDPITSLNHAPVFAAIGERSVGEGLPLSFTVAATDADGDALTYSALTLPAGATFDAGTRTFGWTPGHAAAGVHPATFRVVDDGFPSAASDTLVVTVRVFDRAPGQDLPPVMAALSDRSALVGERLSFRVSATDPEQQAVTYSFHVQPVPPGVALDPASGAFTWTPNAAQAGTYQFEFVATDPGGQDDRELVHVTVTDAGLGPNPPVPCAAQSIAFGGVLGMGLDPGEKDVRYHTFTVPANTQGLSCATHWFGGPIRDLDIYLLDSDSTQVGSAASISNPEVFQTGPLPAGEYILKIVAFTNPDTAHYAVDVDLCVGTTLSAGGPGITAVSLAPPAPNPFRAAARLAFTLPVESETRLVIHDLAGRRVRTLVDGALGAGAHSRVWDRRTETGALAPAGIYFARLVAGRTEVSRKLVLLP